MSKKLPILFLIFLGFLIIIIYSFIHILNKNLNDAAKLNEIDGTSFSNKLPNDYSQIVKNYQNISFEGTLTSKTREPISGFIYQKKFILMLYRLPVNGSQSVNKIVKEQFVASNIPDGVGYYVFSAEHWMHDYQEPFSIEYKPGKPEKTDSIFLNVLGNNTIIIKKNDSVATYSSQLNNFSIRYGVNKDFDFYGKLKPGVTVNDPVKVEFRKYQNSIYLILIYPKTKNNSSSN